MARTLKANGNTKPQVAVIETKSSEDIMAEMSELQPNWKTGTDGRITVVRENIPAASFNAVLQYGFNHLFGNVQQAKLVAEVRRILTPEGAKASSVSTEQVKEYRRQNPEWARNKLLEFEDECLEDVYEGKLGVREAGVTRDPLEARVKKLVLEKVRGIIESKGKKLPKDDSVKIEWGVDKATGQVIHRTRSEFLNNGYNSFSEELRPVAAAQLKKEAEDHAAEMAKVAEADVEELGI
jgi:hypothetical protein